MIDIDPRSPLPLNDQIKAGLRGLVARGLLKPGEQAPSIRALAGQLRVNPNTVARAFRELIAEGVFEARRGDGSYVADGALKKAERGLDHARERLLDALSEARRSGLEWSDIEGAVRAKKSEDK